MKVIFYHTNDSQNTIGKTLNKITAIDLHFSNNQNLNSPQLLLHKKNVLDYNKINYASLLNNYYFASGEAIQNDTLIRFNLKKDVLETYKNDILNSDVDIIEKAVASNAGNVKTSKEVETFKLPSSVVLPKTQSVVMVTVSSAGDD